MRELKVSQSVSSRNAKRGFELDFLTILSFLLSFDLLVFGLDCLLDHRYEGTDSDDFTCSEGERFYLVERVSDDWWKAKSLGGGREGLVPSNYVQAL